MAGRLGMIATIFLLSGCGGDRLADPSECPTPGDCSAEQGSPESFMDSASTSCVDGTGCASGEGDGLESSVLSMAEDRPTNPMPAHTSLDRLPPTNRPSVVESSDPAIDASVPVPDPPVDEASDLRILTDGLFESVGVQPGDVPALLSLMLDGVVLDALDGGTSPSFLGSQPEEVPGRFPTFLELLCREQGDSDSICRQRYGR